jgi:hypothetical protein
MFRGSSTVEIHCGGWPPALQRHKGPTREVPKFITFSKGQETGHYENYIRREMSKLREQGKCVREYAGAAVR